MDPSVLLVADSLARERVWGRLCLAGLRGAVCLHSQHASWPLRLISLVRRQELALQPDRDESTHHPEPQWIHGLLGYLLLSVSM